MNLQKIKNKVEETKYPGGLKALAEVVGMTAQNLHRCVRENKIQAQDLETIAKALGVRVGYFFDEEVSPSRSVVTATDHSAVALGGSATTITGTAETCAAMAVQAEKIKALETLLAEKERLIQVLMAAK